MGGWVAGAPRCPPWEVPDHYFSFLFFFLRKKMSTPCVRSTVEETPRALSHPVRPPHPHPTAGAPTPGSRGEAPRLEAASVVFRFAAHLGRAIAGRGRCRDILRSVP